ncbi:MAG: gene transfer agent family protein [Proteobacteria bacterium]|nr:gene transfer agent family protein [Pseudomonadota bacterium]
MSNDIRGEVEVALGGRTWTMRPTFQAICEIQGRTGKDILTVAGECWAGRFSAVTVAAVLWAAIRAAHDDAPDFEAVGAMIVEEGITTFFEPVLALLANALAGLGAGEDAGEGEGEAKNA